ncbi:hypothetical protein ACIO6T_35850 [Streptomyces sp. NPDC087532]|uniref:hypothetical protein n=1 Tax=unclassified Streptomyces TaxID=2593676 RepID=UPI00331EBB68
MLAVVLDARALPCDTPDYDRRTLDRAALARNVATAALAEDPRDTAWTSTTCAASCAPRRPKRKSVRRSVDRAFPAVAAFLDRERAARDGEVGEHPSEARQEPVRQRRRGSV